MGIPRKHLQRFVSRNSADLHDIKVRILKKTTRCLMSEVVKSKVYHSSFSASGCHCPSDGVFAHSEDGAVYSPQCVLEDSNGCWRQRN